MASLQHHAKMNGSTQSPLKILIVGGGLGGLTAAIALRQAGHEVKVFERSKLANEIGAAIHMAPNATGILNRMGVDVAKSGANLLEQMRVIDASGKLLNTTHYKTAMHGGRWENDWRMAHRANLHTHLLQTATAPGGVGQAVQFVKDCKVVRVDAEQGSVHFADGTEATGDVVLGADGVHSVARLAIKPDAQAFKGSYSAFRFLVSKKSALENPVTAAFLQTTGSMDMWHGADRKVVLYPCVDNTMLNFVCVHPGQLTAVTDTYNTSASKEQLVEVYRNFEPIVLEFFKLADPDTIKVYPLFDMEALPSFTKGKLVVIGDAAHPFTPHLGQGGAMALEDGVSLGVMLSANLPRDKVAERLQLYNTARYARATRIQGYSRTLGDESQHGANLKPTLSLLDCLDEACSHDEFHASTQLLRQHEWSSSAAYWRQPTSFGPFPGPRQAPAVQCAPVECRTATLKFETSGTLLRNLLPNANYRLAKTDTVAQASFQVQSYKNLAWLGGHGYDLLAFYIHDVLYTKKDGSVVKGNYLAVLFENMAEPIVSGREELGFPKVFSDIQIDSDGNKFEARLSWKGSQWAKLSWHGLQKAVSPAAEEHILVHRTLPSVGPQEKGRADADYAVLAPGQNTSSAQSGLTTASAGFEIDALGYQKLPTLQHIVERLAELPNFGVVEASVVDGSEWRDFADAVRID